jgi:hypothetical protein
LFRPEVIWRGGSGPIQGPGGAHRYFVSRLFAKKVDIDFADFAEISDRENRAADRPGAADRLEAVPPVRGNVGRVGRLAAARSRRKSSLRRVPIFAKHLANWQCRGKDPLRAGLAVEW